MKQVKGFKGILFLLIIACAFGAVPAYAEAQDVIDDSKLDKGLITIAYTSTEKAKFKVLIVKEDKRISYPFTADGTREQFPLQLGNGTYSVGLLKNIGGTKYVYVSQKKVTLDLKDPNVVYLNSVQNIHWEPSLSSIEFGETLLERQKNISEKVNTLHGYLVKNVSYDYQKLTSLNSEYIPDIQKTYELLKGICYDYSALFAGIKRSQGVPTRLVKGYSRFVEGYHAWNEVLVDGEWRIIDNTVDSTWKGKDAPPMYKSPKDYKKVNDY